VHGGIDDSTVNFCSNLVLVEAKEVQPILLNLSICIDNVFLEKQAGTVQNIKLASTMVKEE